MTKSKKGLERNERAEGKRRGTGDSGGGKRDSGGVGEEKTHKWERTKK